ncbi:MAG: hypothetical protein JST54_11225 [Deltaproteobacteria bacterium]|nr:hypothetical protein [Deltaproteobacteria bacterium]
MATKPPDLSELQQRLERLATEPSKPPPQPLAVRNPTDVVKPARMGVMVMAVALATAAVATGQLALLGPAVMLAILAGALAIGGVADMVVSLIPGVHVVRDPTRPHVGMGANIARGAIVEAGASVEMGADIGPGAIIKRGAIVRMGCSIGANVVVEQGAVVGWGCDVNDGAVIGRNAIVGAGSDIGAGVRVPDGMRLHPGSDWGEGTSDAPPSTPAAPEPAKAVDPRAARIDAACARIEAELAQAPAQLREMLGASAQTATALRQTFQRLQAREAALRAESSEESLKFLQQERAELQKKAEASSDAAVRGSLASAVAAIDEQLRQRGLLRQSADRLDAELTRLSWTLDGMGAQLVRLRSAGQESASAPDAAVLESMQQLQGEIDAIASALEEVARDDRRALAGVTPVVEVTSEGAQPAKDRERDRS